MSFAPELTKKENRLAILRRAREILSSPLNWTTNDLRKKTPGGGYQYCVLGALERAAYDLRLANEGPAAFAGSEESDNLNGYKIGEAVSLYDYSYAEYDRKPYGVNDTLGYEETLKMLDGYIDKVQLQEE